MRKKLLIWFSLIILSLLLLVLLRVPLMSVAGNYLISIDELQKSDVIFVKTRCRFARNWNKYQRRIGSDCKLLR